MDASSEQTAAEELAAMAAAAAATVKVGATSLPPGLQAPLRFGSRGQQPVDHP